MKTTPFVLAGAASLVLASAASAELVAAEAVDRGDLGAGPTTHSWQIFLSFDDPLDQLLAINGHETYSPLIFDSPVPLIQNNLFEGMQRFDDVPTVADRGGDSWVTIGNADTHNTKFSPNFLGGDGIESVIKGSHFEQLDNGGWFDQDPGTPELPGENGRIIIAQFTLASDGRNGRITFEATAWYNLGGGDLTARAFYVRIPTPGALALLGLAGVAGRRRRRG